MSFDKLPQEVLDQICEEVGAFGMEDACKTLCSLSLTCQYLLPSARRELYRDPIRDDLVGDNLPAADLLLHTLVKSPHLTPLVRELLQLGSATRDRPYYEGGLSKEQAWEEQSRLVNMCQRLKTLGLYVGDVDQAQNLPAIVNRLQSLDVLVLDVAMPETRPLAILSAWNESYASTNSNSHPRLVLRPQPIREALDTGQDDVPFAAGITDLIVVLSETTVQCIRHLATLPHRLLSLTIEATADLDLTLIFPFLTGAGSDRLQLISYKGKRFDLVDLTEDAWEGHNVTELVMPNLFFTSFPAATSLTLTWTCWMSIAKLSLLADASPSLQSLILTGTMWDFELDDFIVPADGGSSIVEGQLIDVLRRFTALRKLDLGLFQVFKADEPFSRLEVLCKTRTTELELSWEGMWRHVEEVAEEALSVDSGSDISM